MPQLDYGKPNRSRAQVISRRGLLRAAFAASGLAAGYLLYRDGIFSPASVSPMPTPALPRTAIAAASQPVDQRAQIDGVYRESIVPLLASFEQRNDQAVDRAMAALHERIQMHRRQIGPFTKDITSWHTRFGILRRYPSDLWRRFRGTSDSQQVHDYVNAKFRKHILSERALEQDVAAVLGQFDSDMAASRNQLYSELLLPLQQIKTIAPATQVSVDQVRTDMRGRAEAISRTMGRDTIATGLAGVAGGWIAADAAQGMTSRIVAQILTRVGTAMAAETIAAGGATLEGSAAGGGVGSFAGPVGTIIGVGVGLVIGAIVDWRLSKRFEAKVAEQCNFFLSDLESRIRDTRGHTPGLRQTLMQVVEMTDRLQDEAIRHALKETDR
ncbi:MAG TPA: hypothetical protein VK797_16560 [Tepidisphaeraceae bacterium]|jgi:hypothetical protein|nr:hypothetical protein [Tepidisphaeraceae bacterium]